jgi:hypothetical protein
VNGEADYDRRSDHNSRPDQRVPVVYDEPQRFCPLIE